MVGNASHILTSASIVSHAKSDFSGVKKTVRRVPLSIATACEEY